jgi:hypothetical protein
MSRHDGDATGKESLEWLSKGYQTLAKVEIETVDFPRVNSKAELERQKGLAPKVCDLGHIPETPENGETPKPTWPDGSLMMDATARHLERGGFLPHIPESEKDAEGLDLKNSTDAP